MRALVVTLKFCDIQPETESRLEQLAGRLSKVDGLLSTNWLRASNRIMMIQSFDTHRAVNAYLDSEIFASLGRIPGSRDIFVTHYDISTRLNSISVLGPAEAARESERELVPA